MYTLNGNMKLFIDDIRNAPDTTWTLARTITAAISGIAQFGDSIEEISIDHDISHQINMGPISRPYPCEETYQPVAHFIGEFYSPTRYPKIVIHSANPIGAMTLKNILEEYGIPSTIEMRGAANRLETEI